MREYHWGKYIHELEPVDIVQFRQWLLENKSRDLARRCLSSFHSVLIETRRQGFMTGDPGAGVTIRAGGRYEDDEEVVIPTDKEIKRLLSAADAMGETNKQFRKAWL